MKEGLNMMRTNSLKSRKQDLPPHSIWLEGKWILNTMALMEQKNHIKLDQDPVRQ